MSHWNQLETQLQSWTPRRPSPKLKQAIFASAPAPAPERERHPRVPAFAWLAPVAACCLTVVTLFSANTNLRFHQSDGRENHAVFTVAMSSLTGSTPTSTLPTKWLGLTATDENLEWNVWSRASFDWTNEGQFLSTNRSLQLARTNLMQ